VADRCVDEAGRPEHVRVQVDALLGQYRLECGERLLDVLRDGERIRAVLAFEHQHHARSGHDRCSANRRRAAPGDGRDVAEPERRAVAPAQHDAGELAGRRDLTIDVDRDALIRVLDETRATHAGRQACGGNHVLDRQAITHQPGRIGLNLQLARFAAEHDRIGHARHAQQLRLDRPLRNVVQVHQRAGL
jgi:hypothetical protein